MNFDDFDDVPRFRPKMGGKASREPKARSLLSILKSGVYRQKAGRGRSAPARRPPAPGQRRVLVKVRVVKANARSRRAASVHLGYIQRDGVEKDGSPGVLYGADGARDARDFRTPIPGERHQFRFIVSPEDGRALDLTAYVREYMQRIEHDLGRKLDWCAVNHYDTAHAHAHIVVRGVDLEGRQVRLAREVVSHGLRERAQELATEELGPRPANVRPPRDLAREPSETGTDYELERRSRGGTVSLEGMGQATRRRLENRLRYLAERALAQPVGEAAWALQEGWSEALRRSGAWRKALEQMDRALVGDVARYFVLDGHDDPPRDPLEPPAALLRGEVVAKGLRDELGADLYAVIQTPSGAGYHVPLGASAAAELEVGDVVAFRRTLADRSSEAKAFDPWIVAREPRLEEQTRYPGRVWLDELAGHAPAAYGFGAKVAAALEARGAFLREQGIDARAPGGALDTLEHRALGERLAKASGHSLLTTMPEHLRGQLRVLEPTPSGRTFVAISEARRLVILEATPELVALDGKTVERMPDGRLAVRWQAPTRSPSHARASEDATLLEPASAEARERAAIGERLARTSRERFDAYAAKFQGRVVLLPLEPNGRAFAQVTDGTRFVIVEATPAVRAQAGRSVIVERSPDGRERVRSPDLDRGR